MLFSGAPACKVLGNIITHFIFIREIGLALKRLSLRGVGEAKCSVSVGVNVSGSNDTTEFADPITRSR